MTDHDEPVVDVHTELSISTNALDLALRYIPSDKPHEGDGQVPNMRHVVHAAEVFRTFISTAHQGPRPSMDAALTFDGNLAPPLSDEVPDA